ncbi:MAG: aminotransferase class V-fold PLP-dependent enzyme [Cyclobacteriaceae bacterium]
MRANFYPGPSRIYSKIPEYLLDGYGEGILSVNHRSAEFMAITKKTKKLLHRNLQIPEDYQIVFTSSATECWEIIAQSLTKKHSHHFYNGAFGEKWGARAGRLSETSETRFGIEEELPTGKVNQKADVICVTQNETSNGTQVSMETLRNLQNKTDQLICADATSSMAGVFLDFKLADVWYASVQKCFGLPAGLGLMILSPRAVERAQEIGDDKRYNSLPLMLENWNKNQSPYTPNVLGIYLLKRTLSEGNPIEDIHAKVIRRYEQWRTFLGESQHLNFLVENEEVRSKTVLTLNTPDPQTLIENAAESGITFGKGYGQWKEDTFRIANFPAIKKAEIVKAQKFLRRLA